MLSRPEFIDETGNARDLAIPRQAGNYFASQSQTESFVVCYQTGRSGPLPWRQASTRVASSPSMAQIN